MVHAEGRAYVDTRRRNRLVCGLMHVRVQVDELGGVWLPEGL